MSISGVSSNAAFLQRIDEQIEKHLSPRVRSISPCTVSDVENEDPNIKQEADVKRGKLTVDIKPSKRYTRIEILTTEGERLFDQDHKDQMKRLKRVLIKKRFTFEVPVPPPRPSSSKQVLLKKLTVGLLDTYNKANAKFYKREWERASIQFLEKDLFKSSLSG